MSPATAVAKTRFLSSLATPHMTTYNAESPPTTERAYLPLVEDSTVNLYQTQR